MKNYKKKISMVLAFIMAITVVLGFNQEVKSNPINTDETVVVPPTTTASNTDAWDYYFGADESWYEGASGYMITNTENTWTTNLNSVGWGGVWGGQVSRTVVIKKNKEYSLNLKMKSSSVNKYVFMKIYNSNNGTVAFADWIYLPYGKNVEYNKTFVANKDADTIAFGLGGDFGDRIEVETDSDAALRYRLLGDNYQNLLKNDADCDPTSTTKISCTNFNLTYSGNETEESDVVVPTRDPYANLDLGIWDTYLGAEEGWYEGASGSITTNNETAWTANLSTVGWGGVWGAQAYREVLIKNGFKYTLKFNMRSSAVNKYVFIKIFDSEQDNAAFGDWVYLPKGEIVEYEKTFTASAYASKICFGFGGEFGDRTGLEADASYRYSLLGPDFATLLEDDADQDPTSSTVIRCDSFALTYADNNTSATTTEEVQTTTGTVATTTTPTTTKSDQTTSATVVATTDEGVQITTNAVEGTTKGGQTTTGNVVTTTKSVPTTPATVAPTTEVVNVGTVKVKTFKRKKNSKKASIVLSKVNQASGYDVQLAAKKNFKKILIKKTFKKVSFTISSAKIKKEKTLYVRARAFIQKDGKKHLGAWSSIKKAK